MSTKILHYLHLAIVVGLPCLCFAMVNRYIPVPDTYIPLMASYIVLVLVLRFVDLEAFLHIGTLRSLWGTESNQEKQVILNKVEYADPILRVKPRDLLGDKNVFSLSKLCHLISEAEVFLPRLRNELMKIVFVNIVIMVAIGLTYASTHPVREAIDSGAPQDAQRAAVTSIDGSPTLTPTFFGEQLRILLSYFAVALQLVWIARGLFHYRERNSDYYAQSSVLR
jgi:hypothetical protein